MKTRKFQEKGQALIVIALAVVILFGFAALAIDGSRAFSDRRNAQNAADTAALAAALAQVRGKSYTTAAQGRATSNSYTDGINGATVLVHLCSDTGVTCSGLPAGATPSEYIQVKIISVIPMTFARVIGWAQITNVVEAIAHVQSTSGTSSLPSGGMVSLSPNGTAYSGQGNFSVNVIGSGIFSNSNSNCSTSFGGNGTIQATSGVTIASGGTQCKSGNVTPPTPVPGSQVPYPPNFSIPAPTFTCSGSGSYNSSNKTFYPGNMGQVQLNGSGTYTFAPGNYCFSGGVSIDGNVNVVANDVNFRIANSPFQINGNSSFTCTNTLVYGASGSGIEFDGNATNTCTSITFYMQAGSVIWNGNIANKFTAPTSGPYKGLLIYMPYGNKSQLTINGNSGNQLTGSIIAVSSPITINGNSGSSGMNTAIIGYTIAVAGNSNTTINYNPAQQYNPPANPSIQFTQ